MDFSVTEPNMFIVNTRLLGTECFLDVSTDREIIKKHGVTKSARKVKPAYTQQCVNFAFNGEPGFCFIRLSDEDYNDFNEAFKLLTGT